METPCISSNHLDKEHPILLYTPPSIRHLNLHDTPPSSARASTAFTSDSTPISSTATSPTLRRTVHFLDRPSPIEDDALDTKILAVLAAEDRFGFFASLARLLERPLALANPGLIQPHTAFEAELNRRLHELSTTATLRANPRRWSVGLPETPSTIATSHGSELSLLELISSRLEARDARDLSQKRPSLKLDHSSDLPSHSKKDTEHDYTYQWWTKAGSWVLDTLSFVPWEPISQA